MLYHFLYKLYTIEKIMYIMNGILMLTDFDRYDFSNKE